MAFTAWKAALLTAYYQASRPARWLWRQQQAQVGQLPIVVLFYHRVAGDVATPWTCSNHDFTRQMRWLQKHFDLLSLAEVQERVRSGRNTRPAVAITFDDGYAENCDVALPLLVELKIPCAYFVSTRYVVDRLPFPHDIACGQRFAPNTPDQIKMFAAAGIEMGAHTRTHPDLAQIHDPHRLHDEVVTASEELQALAGTPVRYFAFPFGQHVNLNPQVFELCHEVGFDGVCSAYGGANFPGDDAFHIQRVATDTELIRIKNRVTRPIRPTDVVRYEYAHRVLLEPQPI